jgi:hypothetical protein
MTRTGRALALASLAFFSLAAPSVLAQAQKLPDQLTWTAYDVGSGGSAFVSTVYSNSFEGTASFPNGWTVKNDCAPTSRAERMNGVAAPNGGTWSLRFLTGPVTCVGVMLLVTKAGIPVVAGYTYMLDGQSRNGSARGTTTLQFLNSAGNVLDQTSVSWKSDAGAFNADPQIKLIAPAGAVRAKIKLAANSASTTMYYDRVSLKSLSWSVAPVTIAENGAEALVTHNGLAMNPPPGTHQVRWLPGTIRCDGFNCSVTVKPSTTAWWASWPSNQTATITGTCTPVVPWEMCGVGRDIAVQSRIETSPGVYELSERKLSAAAVCGPYPEGCDTSVYDVP